MKSLIVNIVAALIFLAMLIIPAAHYVITGLPR